jgi:anti-sigma factor RsiW
MGTKCVECQDLINAYLDGELEEQLRTGLESHLDGCSDCSHKVADLRSSLGQLQETFPDQVPPAELWAKIQARLKTQQKVE